MKQESILRSHTHFQPALATAKIEVCKRVCKPNRNEKVTGNQADNMEQRIYNTDLV
jgi:hypothetical protein